MLRGTDVPTMMTRVETALLRAARRPEGARGVIVVHREGDSQLGITRLRQPASIEVDFPSGSARPVVGPAIRFAKRAVRRTLRWYVMPMMEQQSRFNHAVLDLFEKLRLSSEKLVNDEVQSLMRTVARTDASVDALRADLESLAQATRAGPGREGDDGGIPAALPSTRRSLKYRAFEDRHRGPGADIAKLLSEYVPYFRGRRRVLDVGCGRGEFLGVMRDNGVSAYGVDSDESMVEAARAAGHEVVLADAIAHLRQVEPGAIDGLFASQVAEHLTTAELMTLLDLGYRKLRPGGVIVMETPNPETLFIFAAFFYVDLTHIRPIHPEAMKWAMEASGFDDVRLERILPVPDGTRLESPPDELLDDKGWAAMATNIDRLNTLLYGPQHFAAIGTKPLSASDR